MPSVLGYWKTQGYAQGIRLLLAYVEEEFEDEFHEPGPAPEYSKDPWRKIKHTKGLDFPNLPYYMDGKVKLSQSHAILRYIGRKYNMCGETEEERVRVDLILEEIEDFRTRFTDVTYKKTFKDAEVRTKYLEEVAIKFGSYEKFLGDRPYFAAQKPTFVDFEFYVYLNMHKFMDPNCFEKFPKLTALLERIENIPQIEKYMKSDRFKPYPFWNPYAFFGTLNSGEDKYLEKK